MECGHSEELHKLMDLLELRDHERQNHTQVQAQAHMDQL